MRASAPSVRSSMIAVRARLALLLAAAIAIGILSRKVHLGARAWDKSVGDALYAIAVHLAIANPRLAVRTCAIASFAFCFAIELFQITGIPKALGQSHPWTHWFLGSDFEWHDVLCYAIGVLVVAAIHARVVPRAEPIA